MSGERGKPHSYEDESLAIIYRGGYAPLFAVLIVREESDGTLTGYFGEEGTHTGARDWDADLGWPEPVNAPNLPDVLRKLAYGLEVIGGGARVEEE